MKLIKNILKKIVPPTINILNRNVDAIIRKQDQSIKDIDSIDKKIIVLQKKQDSLIKLKDDVQRLRKEIEKSTRINNEAVWAAIFNNTISNSAWLKDRSFSPGRWAVGYPCLYVMYRILNDMRPQNILEIGLGQSTRMIGQYAAAFDNINHILVEHDKDWINFFINDFKLSSHTKVKQLDREMISYKDAESVRVFKGFKESFSNQKFDFIFIDAPLGSDMKQYSRIDTLFILPDCLSDNFVILIDDFNRIGEQHTVAEIENILNNASIPYKKGKYSGQKDCAVICSEKLGFCTSL